MASTHLQRSISTTGNRKKWTWSAWVKRTQTKASGSHFIWSENGVSTYYSTFMFNDDALRFYVYDSAYRIHLQTNRLFRDTNAWYHIVLTVDTAQATSTDRVKLYVNGVQETSMSTSIYPDQNLDTFVNLSGQTLKIGVETSGNNFEGLMSHINFCDGYAYSSTDFGSTDSTTGIWKPNTSPSVTYGTNGYFLDFASSSDMGNDVSGNNNDFTVTGTMTQTIDTPSNVFPTFGNGDIIPNNSTNTFSNGSLSLSNSSAIWQSEIVPFAFSSGKYYWELKLNHNGGDPRIGVGVMNDSNFNINTSGNNLFFRNQTGGYGFHSGGSGGDNVYANGSSIGGTATSNFDAINGTICGIAVDCDNKRMYLSVNGTWENSANPSNGTNPYDVSSGWTTGDLMFPFITTHNSNVDFNFGNGYFGTTAVASAGTNSGIGTFEYDVPTGFKALCTKSINEQEYS